MLVLHLFNYVSILIHVYFRLLLITALHTLITVIGVAHSESLESNTESKQTDTESTAFKTPTPLSSSTPAVVSQRRSRIKPTVTSVPRSRPNATSKSKATSEAKRLSVATRNDESHLVSQDPASNKDDQLSRRLVLDEQDGQSDADTVSSSTGEFEMKCSGTQPYVQPANMTTSLL